MEASTGYFPDTNTWVSQTFAPTALQIEALTEFASSITFGDSAVNRHQEVRQQGDCGHTAGT
jgi:hypothetical protein